MMVGGALAALAAGRRPAVAQERWNSLAVIPESFEASLQLSYDRGVSSSTHLRSGALRATMDLRLAEEWTLHGETAVYHTWAENEGETAPSTIPGSVTMVSRWSRNLTASRRSRLLVMLETGLAFPLENDSNREARDYFGSIEAVRPRATCTTASMPRSPRRWEMARCA